MKFLISALLSLAIIASPATALAGSLFDASEATYKLYENGKAICSGQFVRSDDEADIFLTAAHCVRDGGEYSVVKTQFDADGKAVYLQAWSLSPKRIERRNDLAILSVDAPDTVDFETIELPTLEDAASLRLGDDVAVIGYPFTDEITITKGLWTGFVPSPLEFIDGPLVRTTAGLAPGSSGGGLYAEFDGEWMLIGTATAVRRDVGFVSWFSTFEKVHAIVQRYVNDGE